MVRTHRLSSPFLGNFPDGRYYITGRNRLQFRLGLFSGASSELTPHEESRLRPVGSAGMPDTAGICAFPLYSPEKGLNPSGFPKSSGLFSVSFIPYRCRFPFYRIFSDRKDWNPSDGQDLLILFSPCSRLPSHRHGTRITGRLLRATGSGRTKAGRILFRLSICSEPLCRGFSPCRALC